MGALVPVTFSSPLVRRFPSASSPRHVRTDMSREACLGIGHTARLSVPNPLARKWPGVVPNFLDNSMCSRGPHWVRTAEDGTGVEDRMELLKALVPVWYSENGHPRGHAIHFHEYSGV